MGYTDMELLELIYRVNSLKPDTFTIVDTFGSMEIEDLNRICSLLNNNLNSNISVSAHLHENLGLAYYLAQRYIEYFECRRPVFVDASLNGIGRVPGNLCIELIMRYLMKYRKANYDINYIYDAIDSYITPIKKQNSWGYSIAYALSATYNVHRTYPEYLLEKEKITTRDIRAILERIPEEESVIYNEEYIKELYEEYMKVKFNDIDSENRLKNNILGRCITIIAPGKSIIEYKKSIIDKIIKDNCVVISVNFIPEWTDTDYVFFTSSKRYYFERNGLKNTKVIVTSNLLHDSISADFIFDYEKNTMFGGIYNTDSVLMLLNIIKSLQPEKVFLVGFDGYNGKGDYYDESFGDSKHMIDRTKEVNRILKEYFVCESKIDYSFLTPSIYKGAI